MDEKARLLAISSGLEFPENVKVCVNYYLFEVVLAERYISRIKQIAQHL